MSILKNAIDSIAIGLEDYESSDDRRILSSTRNIFAGILLLFKHKLFELSPQGSDEALLKQKILPRLNASGEVQWIGKGTKTVDVQNIRERFISLRVRVDWDRLNKINKYRNEIEHYHSSLSAESVQQLISDSFIIIRDFIFEELKEDPKSILGEKYWKILVEVNEVYLKEKMECDATLEEAHYLSNDILFALKEFRCSQCGSDLLENTSGAEEAADVSFMCRACDCEYSYEEIVNGALKDYFEFEMYLSVKEGGDVPIADCPVCIDGVYLVNDRVCVICGNTAVHECERCGAQIPPQELTDERLCSYCIHAWERMLAE